MSSDICDRHHRGHDLLKLEVARARLLSEAEPLKRAAELVDLSACMGRVLAQTVQLDRAEPPVRRSAMDGFAVRSADEKKPRKLLGTVFAGTRESPAVGPNEAVAVMTGGTVAEGADAVIPVELTEIVDGMLLVKETPQAGRHVRLAGEMGALGREILTPHQALDMGDAVAIAGCGVDPLLVYPRPRVTVLSTGDEVVSWKEKPEPQQVRDSNRLAATLQIQKYGGVVVASQRVADIPAELNAAVAHGLAQSDLVVTIGGVSMGSKDHMPEVFARQRVDCLFHGVSVQPGKPVWAGRKGSQWVLGLPGNPVSALVVFELLGKPLLQRLSGLNPTSTIPYLAATAGGRATAKARPRFVLTDLRELDGEVVLTPRVDSGSGDWTSLAGCRALMHIPARDTVLEGQRVSYLPL
jgi:molybdopterin molybdotransferase